MSTFYMQLWSDIDTVPHSCHWSSVGVNKECPREPLGVNEELKEGLMIAM